MEDQEKLYAKGFNNGYLLSRYEPTLLNQIVRSNNSHNEYFQGLVSGSKEHILENSQDRLNDLTNIRNQAKDKGKDIEREL